MKSSLRNIIPMAVMGVVMALAMLSAPTATAGPPGADNPAAIAFALDRPASVATVALPAPSDRATQYGAYALHVQTFAHQRAMAGGHSPGIGCDVGKKGGGKKKCAEPAGLLYRT